MSPRQASVKADETQKLADGGTAYPLARLIEEAQALVGYPPHVVAGALNGSDDEHLTASEAKALVADFLKREIA